MVLDLNYYFNIFKQKLREDNVECLVKKPRCIKLTITYLVGDCSEK